MANASQSTLLAGQAFCVPLVFGGTLILPFAHIPNQNPWYLSWPTRTGREVAVAQSFRRDTLVFNPIGRGR